MAIELLDVVDSAVKIGLGAAIAGVTTYITTKANHDNDKKKELRSHRLKTIETIAENCERTVNSYSGFRAKFGGILRKRTTDDEYQLGDPAIEALDELDKALFAAMDGANTAKARLILMGEDAATTALSGLLQLIADMRNPIMLERKAPSKEAQSRMDIAMKEAIRSFQSELSKVYKKTH